ncbi:MAG: hypothetical protein MJY57_04990 [Bacteroidales bacterium]|nr:hypothetical protein [Bacteroidales bacterium]
MRNYCLTLAASFLMLAACEKEGVGVSGAGSPEDDGHGCIVLGDRLEDPYTVENMTKAFASLYGSKGDRTEVEMTDHYVRFLPSSEEDCRMLEDLGVEMLDHPMDYEIIREGDYYHDPSIPDEEITWQYAVVPAGFKFPSSIRYELIDECCIPENIEGTKASLYDWEAVERAAFELTGNGAMLRTSAKGGSVKPSGKIQIVDDKKGSSPIGVSGVRVSCNVFVKFAKTFTDASGEWTMPKSFSSDPRYRLVFRNRKGFGIGFNLVLVPASTSSLGKHGPEGVSIVVDRNSERKLFSRCVVNNAVSDYFEACENNGMRMKTPPSNLRIWLFQWMEASSAVMMQQGAFVDNTLIGSFLGSYSMLVKIFLPDITLGLDGKDDYDTIYTTAQHECAHASHFAQVGTGFWDEYIKYVITSFVTSGFTTYGVGTEKNHGYCEVGETWAYYLQTKLYRDRYPSSAATFGTAFWFSPQVPLNLDSRGITRFKLFQALTPDVTDIEKFQEKLVNLYPDQKAVINQAFGRYN